MKELLEVREFDSIVCGSVRENSSNCKPLDKVQFDELLKFIREFSSDEANSDALEFMRIGYKRNIGDFINIRNYVGLIQLRNGFQVQILPKIDFGKDDQDNSQTKKVFLKMLRSLKNFPCKAFNDANLKVDKMNLYEIFINMYLQEVRQLVKRGIKSDYVTQEDNISHYKGKLLVNQHIQMNFAHKERFYVAFDEFHPNRPENRLVKATLKKLLKLTASTENSKEIRQLLSAFEMVESSVNYEKDFSKVIIDRNTDDYKMLMQWSKVFLMNKSFSTFSGSSNSSALLFPMERVYESYVAQHIKKIFTSDGWEVSTQDKGCYLFTEPKRFALIPDIVLEKDKRTVIMDTKWKSLVDDESKNYGISQNDMYQMYAYSKKYKAKEVWLLYPMNEAMRNHSSISFESDEKDEKTLVSLHFVEVDEIEKSLGELKNKLAH